MPGETEGPPPEEMGVQSPEPKDSQESKSFIDRIREQVNKRVAETKLPSEGYESTVGMYGGKLIEAEGRLLFDMTKFWSLIDQKGDRLLRTVDEHHVKDPIKMVIRHPRVFLKTIPGIVDAKRYRGNPEQAMENVRRFGLEDFYGPHPKGIEVKQPEAYKKSINLQDIYRQDLIGSPVLNDINRFQATAEVAKYIRSLHDKAGGIAEANVPTFLLTEKEGSEVHKPIVNIPTEIYNPEKEISEKEKKATDLLDFAASIAIEEYRRSRDWKSVEKALETVFVNYGDIPIISMVKSFVKRGRVTLPGDLEALEFKRSKLYEKSRPVFAAHNTQRLSAKADMTAELRRVLIRTCNDYMQTAQLN